MNRVCIFTLAQNLHLGITLSQIPLVIPQGFSLTSNSIKLVLFIALLVYETQNVVNAASSRHVSICNQFTSSCLRAMIFSPYLTLKSSVVVLELSRVLVRPGKIVV